MRKPKGTMILEKMPNRAKAGASSKKYCEKHDEHFETLCLECKREYTREYHRKRKDPFA